MYLAKLDSRVNFILIFFKISLLHTNNATDCSIREYQMIISITSLSLSTHFVIMFFVSFKFENSCSDIYGHWV